MRISVCRSDVCSSDLSTIWVWATRYFWLFFLIQPFDLPERMIAADPDHFLDRPLAGPVKVEGALDPRVVAEYRRCYRHPATRSAKRRVWNKVVCKCRSVWSPFH